MSMTLTPVCYKDTKYSGKINTLAKGISINWDYGITVTLLISLCLVVSRFQFVPLRCKAQLLILWRKLPFRYENI